MSETESNFINCMVLPWKCLIVSWMTKAYGETQLFSHSETIGSSSHSDYLFKKLRYFQGTTFCILAETKLLLRTQYLREHVRSSRRYFKPTVEALHSKNRRYKKQCICLNDLTLVMSRTIFSALSSFSCSHPAVHVTTRRGLTWATLHDIRILSR